MSTTQETSAPINIHTSDQAKIACEKLVSLGYFVDKKDAYKFAVCLAVAYELNVDENVKMTNNLSHTTSIFNEKSSNLNDLLVVLGYEESSIVKNGTLLAEAGLKYMLEAIRVNKDLLKIIENFEQ